MTSHNHQKTAKVDKPQTTKLAEPAQAQQVPAATLVADVVSAAHGGVDPRVLTPRKVIALQKVTGNQQVARMVAQTRASTPAPPEPVGVRLAQSDEKPGVSSIFVQRQPQPQPAAEGQNKAGPGTGQDNPLDEKTKEAIINGHYADKGEYELQTSTQVVKEMKYEWDWRKGKKVGTEVENEKKVIDSTFTNSALETAKQYLDANWAGGIDPKKASGGSGDTKTKKQIDMPGWVYEYQNKLAAQKPRDYVAKSWEKGNNPNWNDDSSLAQRVLEAFLRAWHKKELPGEKEIPSNIEELYKRTGVSEKAYGNAQAQLLGDPNVFGWCGPASYNAVVLGLFKNGLRFDTGKDPVTAATIESRSKQSAMFIKNTIKQKNKGITDDELNAKYNLELAKMALLEEVNLQAAFFIANDTPKKSGWLKGDRVVAGKEAYSEYELQPGDIITQALMNGSPVSGHVLTVVKEERDDTFKGEPGTPVSTIYGISGNAGNVGGGSVKIEKFTREMPPDSLKSDLGAMSSLGNRGTVAADANKKAENAARERLAKEQNIPPHKVSKEELGEATEVERAQRKADLEKRLEAAKADFQAKAGMSYDDFIAAKKANADPQKTYLVSITHKSIINSIESLKSQIRAIDDYTNVPREAAAAGIAYSPSDPRYSEQSGKTGRFRPNELGNMWITTIIKASKYADANKINADLNLTGAEKEKKIKELGWNENITEDEYEKNILKKYGVKKLGGTVESLWPGAMAAIEGEGLAQDYD